MIITGDEPSGASIRTVVRNRKLIGLGLRPLAVVALLSLLTGFCQAALLIVVVRAATALTAETTSISGTIGPLSATDLTTGELIACGFGVLAVLVAAEVALSHAQAKLHAAAQRSARHRILAAYTAGGYEQQVARSRGDIQQVITGHTGEAAALVSSIGGGVAAALNFVALVGSALVLSPLAGLVALVGLGCMVFLMRPLLAINRRWSEQRVNSQRMMTSRLIERLELSRDLRAFGVDARADLLVLESVDDVSSALRRVRFLNRLNSVLYRLGAFMMVLAMLVLIDGRDASNLAALTGALLILLRSLSYGQAAQSAYQTANESVPVIGQLAAEEQRLRGPTPDGVSRFAVPETLGEIEFESVDYAYPGESAVLHDVTFCIRAGEFTAIVGPSGSGKSTIMALLLQLRTPTAGTISAWGVPLPTIDRSRWHERVAYVPQEPRLQSGTVREAIRFHRSWISDDDVVRAAESAHVAEEIRVWPSGFDTPVGQLGDQLSGGQRQRIALARALAGGPELLLLDEPTSALDPRSERLITETLESLRGETTLVVIAHRHATIERADTLIEVDCGRIVAAGSVTARSRPG